nr:signal recognition particle receptor subunit alpha [Smithellaceae bacterium]
MGLFDKLKAGLAKTREGLTKSLDHLVFGKRVLDQALFDELEELMITADMGPQFTYDLIDDVKERVKRKELDDAAQIKSVLEERMTEILQKMDKPLVIPPQQPFVIMAVGVNGS